METQNESGPLRRLPLRALPVFTNKYVATIWVLVLFSFPVVVASEALSYWQYIAGGSSTYDESYAFESTVTAIRKDLADAPIEKQVQRQYAYAPSGERQGEYLFRRYVVIDAKKTSEPANAIDFRVSRRTEWKFDVAVLGLGLWLVLLFSLKEIGTASMWQGGHKGRSDVHNASADTPAGPALNELDLSTQSFELLRSDLARVRMTVEVLGRRSAIMLIAGVVMAFIGLIVFYVTAPTPPFLSTDQTLKYDSYLANLIRPASMLLFIEAMAWFLLRQYVMSVAEWRDASRVASKRAELLAAFAAAASSDSSEARLLLLGSLLSTHSELVLKSGESTENLETSKASASNPIFELISAIVSRLPSPRKPPDA